MNVCAERTIDFRRHGPFETHVVNVSDDADDLGELLGAGAARRLNHRLPDRVASAAEKLSGQRLVQDRDLRAVGVV